MIPTVHASLRLRIELPVDPELAVVLGEGDGQGEGRVHQRVVEVVQCAEGGALLKLDQDTPPAARSASRGTSKVVVASSPCCRSAA